MTTLVSFILLVVLAVLAVRQWLMEREGKPVLAEPFEGTVYRVGAACVAEREMPSATEPKATVICMHGFVEHMGYFTEFYDDPDIQLILLNSCGYHLPIDQPRFRQAGWAVPPSADEGTIEYDAMVMNQALEHLPKSSNIRIHGHSRGGAVALEAASLRPDLFENVEVVLEAPVLPQGRPYGHYGQVQLWCMAFLVPLWRRQPIAWHNRGMYGPLHNERKRQLIEGLPFNPRRVSTMVTNMRSLGEWMDTKPITMFDNIRKGYVLVPDKDKVLETQAMYDSASQGAQGNLEVVRIACSHFPLFDCPESIPALQKTDGSRSKAANAAASTA